MPWSKFMCFIRPLANPRDRDVHSLDTVYLLKVTGRQLVVFKVNSPFGFLHGIDRGPTSNLSVLHIGTVHKVFGQ